jgi:hypothetical protein
MTKKSKIMMLVAFRKNDIRMILLVMTILINAATPKKNKASVLIFDRIDKVTMAM